jgi:hypothetical protein
LDCLNNIESNTAILIIGYNRPALLENLLSRIDSGTRRIYVSIDAPRNTQDWEQVDSSKNVAKAFKSRRDKGETLLNFRMENLGLSNAVVSAIDWAFETEEKLIILEDDVLPSKDFLTYMDHYLDKYQNDFLVWQVGGHNANLRTTLRSKDYLSIFPMIWGWGTWRSRWKLYEQELSQFEGKLVANLKSYVDSGILDSVFDDYWESRIQALKLGRDTWDYQWAFSMWMHKSFSIQPGSNRTLNLGQNSSGTNTTSSSVFLTKKNFGYHGKNRPPHILQWNEKEDKITWAYVFGRTHIVSIKIRAILKMYKMISRVETQMKICKRKQSQLKGSYGA